MSPVTLIAPEDDPAGAAVAERLAAGVDPLSIRALDLRMGQGERLIAAGRRLARVLLGIWLTEGRAAALADAGIDPATHARALVATRCLYGIDPLRAGVTEARRAMQRWVGGAPVFVDHALRRGDRAEDCGPAQLAAFDMGGGPAHPAIVARLRPAHAAHQALRAAVIEAAPMDPVAAEAALRRADAHNDAVRVIGDTLAGCALAAVPEAARIARLALVERWLGGDGAAEAELRRMQAALRGQRATFHLMAEFSELYPDAWAGRAEGGT